MISKDIFNLIGKNKKYIFNINVLTAFHLISKENFINPHSTFILEQHKEYQEIKSPLSL